MSAEYQDYCNGNFGPEDERPAPEIVFECGACDGDGLIRSAIWVYELGCGFGHDDVQELPCPVCSGSGISHIGDFQ